jgi:hypothetical protein
MNAAAAPLETILTLGALPDHEQEERHVSFEFDSKYTTGMGCRLRFSCNVSLPEFEELSIGRRYYVEKGRINYVEIVDMMAELLRLSVQAEMGLRGHAWRSDADRSIFADSIAARLGFALRTITNVDFEVDDIRIIFVTR